MEIESEATKHPGQPPTVCLDSLIEFAAERLAFCVRKSRLKNELSLILYGEDPKYKNVPLKRIAPRSYERIVGKARTLLKQRSLICSAQAREEAVGFYENLIADADTPSFARIKAMENLERIKSRSILSEGTSQEQVIDLNEIDIVIRKKILDDVRNPPNSK